MTFKRKFVRKKIYIPIAALVILILVVTIAITVTRKAPTAPNLDGYTLVFNDEFDGTKLDTSKWATCYDWYSEYANGCSNHGNDELQWYMEDQVAIEGGNAVLTAIAEPVLGVDEQGYPSGYDYRSGMLTTGQGSPTGEAKWTNQYGYYEARIFNPEGQGVWPAFWLLPNGEEWPPEIDIMEQVGHKPNEVALTYFWPDEQNVSAMSTETYVSDTSFANSWHTYAVNWQKGSIDWYIDDKNVRSVTDDTVPSQPMQIALDLAIGGNYPGSPDKTTKFPAVMKIDYVRVYKND